MRERPILFSAPMVQALLAGRKTVTRRLVTEHVHAKADAFLAHPSGRFEVLVGGKSVGDLRNRFGLPGDHLWVRETWASLGAPKAGPYVYRADTNGERVRVDAPWRPSIHMHRTASRLTLEVTSVRVERLHDITEEDAKEEGLRCLSKDGGITWKYGIPDRDGLPGTDNTGWPWTDWDKSPRVAFCHLWASINGVESWAANSWVWRIEFKRVSS